MSGAFLQHMFRDRLGRRLVLATLIVSTFLSGIASAFQLYYSFDRQRDDTSRILEQIEQALAPPLEKALWKFDFEQIDIILDGIQSHGAVVGLSLTTPQNNSWDRGVVDDYDLAQRYALSYGQGGTAEVQVGELVAYLSLDAVYARIWAQFWTLLWSNLVKAYVSATAMLFLFFWWVSRHLEKIADYIQNEAPIAQIPELVLDRRWPLPNDALDTIVDAQNRSRARLVQSITDLEDEVDVRRAAEVRARQAADARKAFLANMSHEIRTPLNAIIGLFQLLHMADIPTRQKKQAEVGISASNRLLEQLVNVLEVSRLEAAAVEIEKKQTNIRDLADQWLEPAQATKHRLQKPIEVRLDVAKNVAEQYFLDERRVTQIVNNLTDNALKFTTAGEVNIKVGAGDTDQETPDEALYISVLDTGPGVPANKRDSIFERFIQIDSGTTREHGGSGLGLTICRDLANLMGAQLTLESGDVTDCFVTNFILRLSNNEALG